MGEVDERLGLEVGMKGQALQIAFAQFEGIYLPDLCPLTIGGINPRNGPLPFCYPDNLVRSSASYTLKDWGVCGWACAPSVESPESPEDPLGPKGSVGTFPHPEESPSSNENTQIIDLTFVIKLFMATFRYNCPAQKLRKKS